MFERRLKIFLGILLGVMSVLLMRAVHLQVLTRSTWAKAAEDFKKRPVYVETTRGRILDYKGVEMAVDVACMDACVDYRAISRNRKWMNGLAAWRVKDRLGSGYSKTAKAAREEMVAREAVEVERDVDRMFQLLAEVSGRPLEEIEETCRTIDLKVAMRSRWVQYKRYQKADEKHDDSTPPPWYRRWLVEGGDGGPNVDDFEQESGEAVEAHPIVRDISQAVYTRLAKEGPRCPGLVLRQGTTRRYPRGRAGAHVLGMLSPVKRSELLAQSNLDDELRKYDFTDLLGRGGIEGLAEPTLRGSRGKSFRRLGEADEVVSPPVPGQDVRTTIDVALQGDLQQMFEHMMVPSNHDGDPRTFKVAMHGAAVVIDLKTSEVRALASYPDYDANDLTTDYKAVADRKDDKPLVNRATQWSLEPGSTIKPVVGIGAITQGVNLHAAGPMTPHTGIECTGFLVLNGRRQIGGRCWVASRFVGRLPSVAHHPIPIPHAGAFGNPPGHLTFPEALERSCNIYFETLADRLKVDGLSWWYDQFGLGRETGVGIAESTGLLPRDLKRSNPADAWFGAIGQTSVLASPIQMANVAATIARDGTWMRPRLIAEPNVKLAPVKPRDADRAMVDRVDLKLSKEALSAAREGMRRVVNAPAGTGDKARMTTLSIAGKTGTAQAAPLLDPKLDAAGAPIYLDRDGNRVNVDHKGFYTPTDPKGNPLLDAQGERVRLEATLDTVERPLASADVETAWPWYRGWGEQGTARNHAWFIGFAPAEDPQIAFAVMIEYGGSGNFAAKVATQVMEKCLAHGHVKAK